MKILKEYFVDAYLRIH